MLDNLSTGRRSNLEPALSRGREAGRGGHPRRRRWWARCSTQEKPEVVFHLAAQIDVRVSTAKPVVRRRDQRDRHDQHARGRAQGAARGGSCSRRPAARSTARPTCCRRPRTRAINSEAPYGQAKYAAEGYCDLWSRLHGLSTVSLRFGNVYGPRQDPLGEAGVVAIFCGKLRDGGAADRVRRRPPDARLRICGATSCGRCMIAGDERRDRLRSTSAAARRPRCSTWSTRCGELGARARASLNGNGSFEAAVRAAPARARCSAARSTRARSREVLGFEAEVDLEDGLRRTLQSVVAGRRSLARVRLGALTRDDACARLLRSGA